MDISFSPEHEAFREEVRAFLDENLDAELIEGAALCPGFIVDYDVNIRWHRILHAKGWVAPAWPVEHGGTGWDITRRYLFSRECALAGAPSLAPMGLGMCGPVLIGYGSDAQKAHYLPRMLSGEHYWCQGYSEPGSGSDLASLRMRADVDGEDYVLNGSKIWTTHAHYADHMFCLVRTDSSGKPQQGITFLLLEMNTPGITVEPIIFASGDHEVNQVFFEDVRVPRANRVGKENDGWTVAKYLLEFERGGGSGAAGAEVALRRVRNLAHITGADQEAPFRRKLDETEIKVNAVQFTELRIHAALSNGERPGPESSIMKNLSADLGQRINELAIEALGHYGVVYQPDARVPGTNEEPIGPPEALVTMPRYLNNRASSIAGGTNEVQKNIVAKLVLGL